MTNLIRYTMKQMEILNVIKKGRSDGTDCDVYDIVAGVSYDVKRDAMLHSVKILIDHGYIERKDRVMRDGRSVRTFRVTTKASELI
jgi:hypothetical protein